MRPLVWGLSVLHVFLALGALQLFRLRSDILARLSQEAQRSIHGLETELESAEAELRALGKVGRRLVWVLHHHTDATCLAWAFFGVGLQLLVGTLAWCSVVSWKRLVLG